MTTSVEELGREIALIKRTLAGLTQPQLGHSSLEDAAINEYDRDGLLGSIIGLQYDGSHGAVPVSGPIPPVPAGITAEPVPNGIIVRWQGEYVPLPPPFPGMVATPQVAPMDFALAEVHASTDPNFTGILFDTKRQEIVSARGGEVFIPVGPDVEAYVRLVTRTLAGKRSLPSTIVGPVLGGKDPLIAGAVEQAANAAQLAEEAQARATQAVADAETARLAAVAAEESAGAVTGDVAAAQQAADDAASQAAAALEAAQAAASTGTSAQQAADTAASAAAAAQEAADAAGTVAAQADAAAAQAAADAAQAVADAAAATSAAGTAQGVANSALTAANGRNRIFTQATKPSGTGYIAGDLWIDTANGRRLSAWDPAAAGGAGDFVVQQFGNSAIAPGTLVASDVLAQGTVTGALLKADAIDGKTITGALVRTAPNGQRIELDSTLGLVGYDAAGVARTRVATDGKLTATGATVTGIIQTAEQGARIRIAQTVSDGTFTKGAIEWIGEDGAPSTGIYSEASAGGGSFLRFDNGDGGAVDIYSQEKAGGGGTESVFAVTADRIDLGLQWAEAVATTQINWAAGWGTMPLADAHDPYECFDSSAANWCFICPVDGDYGIDGVAAFSGLSAGVYYGARIAINGVVRQGAAGNVQPSGYLGSYSAMTGRKRYSLLAGDRIQLQGYLSAAATTRSTPDGITSVLFVERLT